MPSRKEKCPTCGSTVKKQEYKSQIQTKRMRYSKECLSLIDLAIKEINASRAIQLTDTDVHAFLSEIDGCDTDMIIMSLNNYLKKKQRLKKRVKKLINFSKLIQVKKHLFGQM